MGKTNTIANRIVLLLWSGYTVLFVVLSLSRHAAFATGLDLAIYDHYIWNISNGDFVRNSIIDVSDIWNYYFAPLLVIFVPIKALWNDARALLVAQTVFLASSVFPIYWYARRQLGNGLAVIVSGAFFLYPALEFVNVAQFHVISLTVPLLSFGTYLLLRFRYRAFLACAILLLLVKEEALFAVLGVGLYIFLIQRKRILGLSVFALASAWFLILLGYLFPALTGRSYFFARPFPSILLGSGIPEIAQSVLYHPEQILSVLLSTYNLEFAWGLLFPLALTPLGGIDALLIGLPALGMIFLTRTPWLASQYPASVIAPMFFAAIAGLKRLTDSRLRLGKLGFGLVFSFSSITGYALLGPGPFGGRFEPESLSLIASDVRAASYAQWVGLVPADATVIAQEETLPHFSGRRFIYSFSPWLDCRKADYLVAKRYLRIYNLHQPFWDSCLASGFFEILMDQDGFLVAKRKDPEKQLDVRFGDNLKLVGYSIWPRPPWVGDTTLRPIVAWQAETMISEKYSFVVQVVDSQGHVWAKQTTGPHDGATPTTAWRPGQTVGDQFLLALPPTMPTGDYQMVLEVHRANGDYVEVFDSADRSQGLGLVLETVRVQKSKQSVNADQMEMGERLYVDMHEVRFLGYELANRQASPGQVVQLGIYWRARGKPRGDYEVAVQLRGEAGRTVFEQRNRPANGAYPTTEWDTGEVLLDWHDFELPPFLLEGDYALRVALFDSSTGATLGEVALGSLTVAE
ncbi:MAG: DUF2079 domain-containing protein [Chloroflexi bacterium]|nr:DUF2079 domain-containing protein [Chloroflexota bacterium]